MKTRNTEVATKLHNGRAILGQRVRDVRKAMGKTLLDVEEITGLSKSTLSKIENGTLSVSYDNLVKLARGLSIDLSALFAEGPEHVPAQGGGRRSVIRKGGGEIYETPMYHYEMLCTDLNPKKLFPIVTTLRAHSIASAADLIRHPGEEFVYVLEGVVEVYSEFYSQLRLTAGDCIYIDSTMGHALISVGDSDARILWVATEAAGPSSGPPPKNLVKSKQATRRSS